MREDGAVLGKLHPQVECGEQLRWRVRVVHRELGRGRAQCSMRALRPAVQARAPLKGVVNFHEGRYPPARAPEV